MDAVIQKLSSLQRPAMLRHLQTLSPEDLRLRFGTYMKDAALDQYVNRIDFMHDKVFGVYGRDMSLIGMAHLALDRDHHYAELGLSVEPAQRGNGYGLELLHDLRARTKGRVEWVVLDWNEPSIKLYESLGAKPVTGWTRYRWLPEC